MWCRRNCKQIRDDEFLVNFRMHENLLQCYTCFTNTPFSSHLRKNTIQSTLSVSNSGLEDVFFSARYWKPLLTSHISLELPAVKRM